MFDDLIQKESVSEENPATPKCNFLYKFEKCEYYIPKKNDYTDCPICEFFGDLTNLCYLDKFDI
jgi:hypothetical protein